MRKLNIEEVWDYTKRMWEWIAFQKEVMEVERTVDELKKVWLEENMPEFLGMTSNCFFCYKHDGLCEKTCPGSLVAGSWGCCDYAHNYCAKPGAFYREILRLDAIRTAEPVVVEHEWVHGDVMVEQGGDYPKMYVDLDHEDGGPRVIHLQGGRGNKGMLATGNLASYFSDEPVFLFNVNDIVKDKL